MKKILISFLFATLFVSLGFSQVKEKRDVDNFTSIGFGVAGDLYVSQGSQFSVTLEGDQDLLDEITTTVKNGRLVIRKPDWRSARNKKLTAHVTMPVIDGLSLSGSGHLVAEGAIKCKDLDLSVSGSGSMDLNNLEADMIEIGISGSGSVDIEGEGSATADVSISGSGSISAENFAVKKAEIGISGSGRCKIWVEESLIARVSGSGSIYYKGTPNIDAKSSGSGRIKTL